MVFWNEIDNKRIISLIFLGFFFYICSYSLRLFHFMRHKCTCRVTKSRLVTFVLLYLIIQLLTGFEDNSSFVWHKDGSVARSHRLRATNPFEGQTKLLLSEKSVYNSFVAHLHFQNCPVLWTNKPSFHSRSSRRYYALLWYYVVKMTWLVETMIAFHVTGETGRQHCHCCYARRRMVILVSAKMPARRSKRKGIYDSNVIDQQFYIGQQIDELLTSQ